MELILLIGCPGAGKTTFVERYLHATHARLSLDECKSRGKEADQLKLIITSRCPLVVDNTNISALHRARYIMPAKIAGYRIKGYFFEPDRTGSLKRNKMRSVAKIVPSVAIYTALKRLERPNMGEGFDELFSVSITPFGTFFIYPFH